MSEGAVKRELWTAEPVEFELFRNTLHALADDMALTVLRTAQSSIVRESMDFATGICDVQGQLIAQGLTLPVHLGSIPDAIEAALREVEHWDEGDIVILNDPYFGGMHLPDIFMIQPIFAAAELVGFTVVTMHHADVGGAVSGSVANDSREIFQEGVRIPPIKLYESGVLDEKLLGFLLTQVRLPEVTRADLHAQQAACEHGCQGIAALVSEQGRERYEDLTAGLLDYTEQLARAELRQLPDGTYEFEDFLDGDGIVERPVRIHVRLTITDGLMTADLSGSEGRADGAINCTLSFTKSAVYAAARSLMGNDVPNNAGFFRVVSVVAAPGLVAHATFPAAVAARGVVAWRVMDVVFGALSQADSSRVFACSDGGVNVFVIAGYVDDVHFQVNEPHNGSWGGRPHADGIDGMSNIGANVGNASIEEAERTNPVRVVNFGFVPDSCGPGKFRGGLALVKEWQLLAERATTVVRAERQRHRSYGLVGGGPGEYGSTTVLVAASGEVEKLPSKVTAPLAAGDRLRFQQAGAGGWGPPSERAAAAVRADLADGKITLEYARRHHPHALEGAGSE